MADAARRRSANGDRVSWGVISLGVIVTMSFLVIFSDISPAFLKKMDLPKEDVRKLRRRQKLYFLRGNQRGFEGYITPVRLQEVKRSAEMDRKYRSGHIANNIAIQYGVHCVSKEHVVYESYTTRVRTSSDSQPPWTGMVMKLAIYNCTFRANVHRYCGSSARELDEVKTVNHVLDLRKIIKYQTFVLNFWDTEAGLKVLLKSKYVGNWKYRG